MNFKVDVHTQMAKARLAKAKRRIQEQGTVSVKDMVTSGKEYLRGIVPFDTGFLYRTIKGEATLNSGKIKFEPHITPKSQRRAGDESGWRFPTGTFSLVRWMAQSPKAKNHFRNMSPQNLNMMKSTRGYLQQYKGRKVKQDFKKLKL